MKHVPNAITMLRIFLSILLLFIKPLAPLFMIIYLLCGFSDVLDGYIARKTNSTSQFGSMLDSIADFVAITIILIILLPIIEIPNIILIWVIAIALVRLLSLSIGFYKYSTFVFLHTYSNKTAGLALFCFPLLVTSFGTIASSCFVCIIATISAIEELLITSISTELSRDVKCIFTK